MINARPNLNGNSAKDFADAASQLNAMLDLVEDALKCVQSNVFHGRNYQTIPDWQQRSARAGDDVQMKAAWKNLSELRYLYQQIAARALNPEGL